MDRRKFVLSAAGALIGVTQKLWADHHVVSADPLIVEFDLSTLADRYTRVEDFYVRNHYETPETVGPFSLRIEGEVNEPQQLTMERLKAMPEGEIRTVLECAGDPTRAISLVSDGVWRGWRLRDVLSPARPRATGTYLQLFGRDGFSRSVPIDRAMNDGWLATSLGGRPLLANHGAPWRALFPGWYGMDSVKWLERIVVSTTSLPPVGSTYLEIRKDASGRVGAKLLPRVQVKSVITAPEDRAVLRRGKVQVRGLAWSGYGSIRSVQVSADGGTSWQRAAVNPSTSPYDWTLWNAALDLSRPGVVEVMARATDSAGNTQPEKWYPDRLDQYAYNVCSRVECVVV